MPGFMESLSTVNSAVRTILAVIIVGAVGVLGWLGYERFTSDELQVKEQELTETRQELDEKTKLLEEKEAQLLLKQGELLEKDRQISALNEEVAEQQKHIDRLDTSLRLLKIDHRVAWFTVLEQAQDPDGQLVTLVEFVELDDQGQPVDKPQQFRVKGDVIYIDSWIVKFDDRYVEEADLDRSTSLVVFRRIFGEQQEPKDGFPLDPEGDRPKAYGGGSRVSDFEQKIWSDFWEVANDEAKQQELGIRAAHGDAPSIKVKKGKSYRVQLRASDGLSITPDDNPPPIVRRPVG